MEMQEIERKEAWLTESAVKFITHELLYFATNKKRIFEFGSGQSTIWFSQFFTTVISVEHDFTYYTEIFDKLKIRNIRNVDLYFQEQPYNKMIELYDDEDFDLILVDGRNRVKCIQSAIPKLRRGGWLVLDNSEREYYKAGKDLMKTWNQIHFVQNQPDKYGFTYPDWTTSIYIKT